MKERSFKLLDITQSAFQVEYFVATDVASFVGKEASSNNASSIILVYILNVLSLDVVS